LIDTHLGSGIGDQPEKERFAMTLLLQALHFVNIFAAAIVAGGHLLVL
jgi:hypothetical protein